MKRLTIDIPASLHSRIKVSCAQRGVKMADEIRELLATHFHE
jgi:plasmid stability protein